MGDLNLMEPEDKCGQGPFTNPRSTVSYKVAWSKDDVGLVLCEVLSTRSQDVTPNPSFPCISRGNLFNLSDCSVNASLAGGL